MTAKVKAILGSVSPTLIGEWPSELPRITTSRSLPSLPDGEVGPQVEWHVRARSTLFVGRSPAFATRQSLDDFFQMVLAKL